MAKNRTASWLANKLLKARAAGERLGALPAARRTAILLRAAREIESAASKISATNRRDLAACRMAGANKAFLDRLELGPNRLQAMADGVRAIAGQPDPIGQAVETRRRPNGLVIRKVRVPIGLVGMIYESRPNVTADAAALCLRSGNAVALRTGREALGTSAVIAACFTRALASEKLQDAVLFVDDPARSHVRALLSAENIIDVIIPRGGPSLIREVSRSAKVPVIKHYDGICHTYVDRAADLAMARKICFNAKVQRPGVCNAMETMLVHRAVAPKFLPAAGRELAAAGVDLRACPESRRILKSAGVRHSIAKPADFGREFLDLILAVKIVDSIEAAIEHIARYGSRHSDAIVSNDRAAQELFLARVDSSSVFVNASTRFADGGEYGLGAEIGISTDRLHARGPMGAQDLTTTKYVVSGRGQIRS